MQSSSYHNEQIWMMRPDTRDLDLSLPITLINIYMVIKAYSAKRAPMPLIVCGTTMPLRIWDRYDDCYIIRFVPEPPIEPGSDGLILASINYDTGDCPIYYWRDRFWYPTIIEED